MPKFTYEINIELPLDLPEVERLIAISQTHYDGRCKAAGQVGGVFYGWRNSLEFAQDAGDTESKPYATARDLSTAAKTLEMSQEWAMVKKLCDALNEITAEWMRLNPQ